MMVTSVDDDGRVGPPRLHGLVGGLGREPLYDAMRALAAVVKWKVSCVARSLLHGLSSPVLYRIGKERARS
jgi:hypothetical protein